MYSYKTVVCENSCFNFKFGRVAELVTPIRQEDGLQLVKNERRNQ